MLILLINRVKLLLKLINFVKKNYRTNNTNNYLFLFYHLLQSLFGWALFQESLNLMWWGGFSLIVLGFVLMITGQKDKTLKTS